MSVGNAPVLLTMADFNGTLAAVRSLGRHGVKVVVAGSSRFAPASWSKHVARRVRCPDVIDAEAFLAWLLEFGSRAPGHVLLPTSDDTAWLYSKYQHQLRDAGFVLCMPPFEGVHALLDKRRLHAFCGSLDIDVPATWFPEHVTDIEPWASALSFPVLVKPRTQVLFPSRSKGTIVACPSALSDALAEFGRLAHHPWVREVDPDVGKPMVQRFYHEAAENIYNLSGFVGTDGEIWGTRAGVKVMQRPRNIGIGVCFAEAPVDASAVDVIRRLVDQTGYFGVFEAEFIRADDRNLLIDFNPRFYGQMEFDIHRGLPLALLSYALASGATETLRQLRDELAAPHPPGDAIYTHRLSFEAILILQGLSGALSKSEVSSWRDWYRSHKGRRTDAVFARDDLIPGLVDIVRHLHGYAKHPRSTYRQIVRNRR